MILPNKSSTLVALIAVDLVFFGVWKMYVVIGDICFLLGSKKETQSLPPQKVWHPRGRLGLGEFFGLCDRCPKPPSRSKQCLVPSPQADLSSVLLIFSY